jgi:hypothetical protein
LLSFNPLPGACFYCLSPKNKEKKPVQKKKQLQQVYSRIRTEVTDGRTDGKIKMKATAVVVSQCQHPVGAEKGDQVYL